MPSSSMDLSPLQGAHRMSLHNRSRRLSNASMAFATKDGGPSRYSLTGQMRRPSAMSTMSHRESNAYSKRAAAGMPSDLMALTVRLEELREKKQVLEAKATQSENRKKFITEHCGGEFQEFRVVCWNMLDNTWFDTIMITVIIINVIFMTLPIYTRDSELAYDIYVVLVDPIFLSVYILEAFMKIYVYRKHYFQKWDLFDFIVVMTSILDFSSQLLATQVISKTNGQGSTVIEWSFAKIVRIVRTLRIMKSFRTLRLLRMIDDLRVIVSTITQSLLEMGAIVCFIVIILIVFSTLGYQWFGDALQAHRYFGTWGTTAMTLFQLLTLDDWYEIFTTVSASKDGTSSSDSESGFHFLLFMFLLVYIFVVYFICLNLMIAVIVDNFQVSLGKKISKIKIQKQVEQEEAALVQKVEGNLGEISDTNLRAQLAHLSNLIGNTNDADDIEYESSESEMDEDEIEDAVLKEIRESSEQPMTEKEEKTTLWYYRILAGLEKQMHIFNDQMATHKRIIELLVDDTEDVLQM